MTTKETLKKWFRTGEKPTQAQFWAWLESYHHKEETIPAKSVEGLPQLMERSLVQNQFENHQTDPLAHAELFENKVDKEQGKGLSANDFTDEYKQQLDELAQQEKTEIDTENFFLKDEKITLIQGTNTEAPLNFQQGNLTYSPRNGQVEYSENGLFFTHDNQRRQVVFIDDTGLTTQQIAQKLKRIIKGEQFTIKYTDGTMTSAKYNELLEAVKDKQVEEIQVDTAGLEGATFNFEYYKLYAFRTSEFNDVKDLSRKDDFDNSGFYLDVFDRAENKLLKRNKYFLKDLLANSSLIYSKNIISKTGGNTFIRVSKFGNYTDYEVKFYNEFISENRERTDSILTMRQSENEMLLEKEVDNERLQIILETKNQYTAHFSIMVAKKIRTSTLTNLFVNDTPVTFAENFIILRGSHAGRRYYKGSNMDPYQIFFPRIENGKIQQTDFSRGNYGRSFFGVGDHFDDIDHSLENSLVETRIHLKTTDKIKGYYKIQLINTENQEVVFEKDNREDNTDTITLNNLQLPKMLTIKLWTNDSLND